MRTWWTVYQYQEASLLFAWADPATGVELDFSDGYTFTFRLVSGGKHYLEKLTGILGSSTTPNVDVQIGAGELENVPPGLYAGILTARRIADSVDFTFRPDDPPIVKVLKTPVVAT